MSSFLNLSANDAVNDALVHTSFASSFNGSNFTLAVPVINISDDQLIDPENSMKRAKRKSARLITAILATAACGTVGILAPQPTELMDSIGSAYHALMTKPSAPTQLVVAQASTLATTPAPNVQPAQQEAPAAQPPASQPQNDSPAPAAPAQPAAVALMPSTVPPLPSGPIVTPMPPAPGQVMATKPITNLSKPLPIIPMSDRAIASVSTSRAQVAEPAQPASQQSPLLVLDRDGQQPATKVSTQQEEQSSNQFAIPATPKHGTTSKQKRSPELARQAAPKQSTTLESDQEKSARLLARAENKNSDSVKRLLTTSAEKYGIRSLQPEGILIESKAGPDAQPLVILLGDYLPNGERLIRVDPKANTVVTDHSVIRFN